MPRLCTCKGDVGKSWYVYFHYTDDNGEKQLCRYKFGINRIKSKRAREKEGAALVQALKIKLESGWNPLTKKTTAYKLNFVANTLFDLLDIKKAFITPRTYKTYYDQINLFKKWLESKAIDKLYISSFTDQHARSYSDWLLRDKQYCGKTHNSHLNTMRCFFNGAIERELVTHNPFKAVKAVRQEYGHNTTYSRDEEEKVKTMAYKEHRLFFYATQFVRYCFFRRSELASLQRKHIIWDNKTIIVPSKSAKNRTQDSITISSTLEKYILEMNILELDPEMYIFSKNFEPSFFKLKRVDDFSDQQREINRILGIKKEATFYSWKHTGAVELYNITKDPYTVMRQCRHSDIRMTMIYLRSLGCGVSEQVRAW